MQNDDDVVEQISKHVGQSGYLGTPYRHEHAALKLHISLNKMAEIDDRDILG